MFNKYLRSTEKNKLPKLLCIIWLVGFLVILMGYERLIYSLIQFSVNNNECIDDISVDIISNN